MKRLSAVLLASSLLACSGSSPKPDAGQPIDSGTDSGVPDAGPMDSGVADSGTPDAGVDGGTDGGLSTACAARLMNLQAALDQANSSPAAAFATASADCPTLTVVSGASSDAGTLFRIGSVTKTYVTATVIELEHAGSISLDDTLDKYSLPVPDAGAITVRQLLQHTSGLFNYTDDTTALTNATRLQPQTPEALVAIATAHPPYFAPGAGWHYSNTNFILLGMIVKSITGGEVSAAIAQNCFVPAGLHDTFLDGEQTLNGTLVPGFDNSTDVTFYLDPSWAWTAGSMVATPADVADWVYRLYGGAVLPDGGTAELTANAVSTGPSGVTYGLGTEIFPAALTGGAGPGIGHDGAIPGYQAFAFYFPDKQTSIVAVVDSDTADINSLFVAALTTLFP